MIYLKEIQKALLQVEWPESLKKCLRRSISSENEINLGSASTPKGEGVYITFDVFRSLDETEFEEIASQFPKVLTDEKVMEIYDAIDFEADDDRFYMPGIIFLIK